VGVAKMQIIVAGSSNWLSGESNRLKHCSTCFAGWKVSEITFRKIGRLNASIMRRRRCGVRLYMWTDGIGTYFEIAIDIFT
jgi:hypothetical protein